jgi:PadR family transcriptional regulator, regulatory protein PadR
LKRRRLGQRSALKADQSAYRKAAHHYRNNVVMLGEFEYLLLSATARLGEDAYGATIRHEIENSTGGHCSLGAVHTTLDRLEAKGLIETWIGGTTPRGGRPKRMVRVATKGLQAAAFFYDTVVRASRGVSWETERERGRRSREPAGG